MERLSPVVSAKAWGEERREFAARADFPVLVKTIEVRDRLSVQVHPGALSVKATGGRPKAEMWCILEPGEVWAGLKEGVGEGAVRRAMAEGTLPELLVRREVSRYDVVYIAPGLVHCSGGGARFYEVQQDSDTTWRLYDWDRRDERGNARELHVDEALASIDWSLPPPEVHSELKTPWFWFSQYEAPAEGGAITAPAASPLLAYDVARGVSTLLSGGEELAVAQGRHFITTLPLSGD